MIEVTWRTEKLPGVSFVWRDKGTAVTYISEGTGKYVPRGEELVSIYMGNVHAGDIKVKTSETWDNHIRIAQVDEAVRKRIETMLSALR